MSSVWYVGNSKKYSIKIADWNRSGIAATVDLEWTAGNGYSIPTATFSVAQLAVLAADPNFLLNQADGPRNPSAIGTTPTNPGGSQAVTVAQFQAAMSVVTGSMRRPANNTVIGLGASIVTWLTINTSYLPGCFDNLLGHLCVESMQRMKYGGCLGHDGYTQAQIISSYLPTVLAMNPAPGACIYFDAPFNDIGTGVSLPQVKANLNTVVTALTTGGIVPILATVPSHYFGAKYVEMAQWNRYIRRFAAMHGYPLIDLQQVMQGIDDNELAALTADTVHPNPKGHKAIAKQAVADGLLQIFPPQGRGLTSRWIGDLANMLNDGTNNIGLFNADTNADGVADGWTLNSGLAAKCSVVVPADLVHDFTTKTDGAVGATADSGQTWTQVRSRAGAAPAIAAGRFVDPDVATGASASYLSAELAGTITHMQADFDLSAAGSTSGETVALVAFATPVPNTAGVLTSPVPDSPCHLVIASTYLECLVYVGGTPTSLGAFVLGTPITTQLAHVEVTIDKENAKVYVLGPDGKTYTFSHPAIGSITAPYATCETFLTAPNTDHRPQIAKFRADATPLRNSANTPAANLIGKWQQISLAQGDATVWLLKILSTGYSAGDVLAISARVQTTGIDVSGAAWTIGLNQYFAGGYTYPAPGSGTGPNPGSVQSGCVGWLSDVVDGLVYAEVPVLAGSPSVFAQIQVGGATAAGQSVVRVGEFTIVNLTTGAILS